MADQQGDNEAEAKQRRKEEEAAKYELKKIWAKGRTVERNQANEHYEKMLFEECKMQYLHWKNTVTEEQKAQGMRDYEKYRRTRSFRDAEMNQLKSSFAKVLGLL